MAVCVDCGFWCWGYRVFCVSLLAGCLVDEGEGYIVRNMYFNI